MIMMNHNDIFGCLIFVYKYNCGSSGSVKYFFNNVLFLLNEILFVNVSIVVLDVAKLLYEHLKKRM